MMQKQSRLSPALLHCFFYAALSNAIPAAFSMSWMLTV